MMSRLMLLLELLGGSPQTVSVSESVGPSRVAIQATGAKQMSWTIRTHPRTQGKLGWSFDLSKNCDLVTIESANDGANAALVLYRSASMDAGVSIFKTKRGLSSPAFSPDGTSLVVIEGVDQAWCLSNLPASQMRNDAALACLPHGHRMDRSSSTIDHQPGVIP